MRVAEERRGAFDDVVAEQCSGIAVQRYSALCGGQIPPHREGHIGSGHTDKLDLCTARSNTR